MTPTDASPPRRTLARRIARAARLVAAALLLLAATAAATAYLLSERRLAREYPYAATPLPARGDTVRGRHLATAVLGCTGCHGADLGGRVLVDAPPMRIAPPNLTRGRGGVGTLRTDAHLARALRHGLRVDGRPLLLMPSDVYAALSDDDLASVVAYVRTRPPVDRDVGRSALRPLGRALLAAGVLDELSAERIPHARRAPAHTPTDTVGTGRYLADVAGCTFCHGATLGGRAAFGPPGAPAPPPISRAALAGWTEADFTRALRTGRRPDGRMLAEFMPWRSFARLTDAEVHALWRHLQERRSPPAIATGAAPHASPRGATGRSPDTAAGIASRAAPEAGPRR